MPALTWLGHATFLVADGGHAVVIDPFLAGNQVAAVSAEDVQADRVVLTHGHDGHIADAARNASANGAAVRATSELAMHMQSLGLGCAMHARHDGGARELAGDMKLIGERHDIDLAILPLGDNPTMGPEHALHAAGLGGSPTVVPCHDDTFDHIAQDGAAFARAVTEKGMRGVALAVGETLEF